MRYIIEVKTNKADKEFTEFLSKQKNTSIEFIQSYDPKEKILSAVERLGAALREYKVSGISWNVFTTYLKGKGHSNKEIEAVLGDVSDFFEKIGMLPEEPAV